jgi:hypothetical protein
MSMAECEFLRRRANGQRHTAPENAAPGFRARPRVISFSSFVLLLDRRIFEQKEAKGGNASAASSLSWRSFVKAFEDGMALTETPASWCALFSSYLPHPLPIDGPREERVV